MADIFKEVDESLNQARVESLWKQYRGFVYTGAALVISAIALNEFVLKPGAERAKQDRTRGLESAITLLEDGKYTEAEAALKAIAEGKTKLAPVAASYLARARYEGGGNADGAREALGLIAKDEGGPIERLALLRAAYFTADTQTLADLEAALGLLKDEDSAIGAMARELIAAKAWETGDAARARTDFSRLQFDPKAPPGVKERAEMALAIIPLDAAPTTASDPAQTETGSTLETPK